MIQDIDRPDVNGNQPKMQDIRDQVMESLAGQGLVPTLSISTNDNIMSSVSINGAFDTKEQWTNGIFENGLFFRMSITPMKGKRYYDSNDPKVTLKLFSGSHELSNLRKYTGPIDKVIAKLRGWILVNFTTSRQTST